MPSTTSSLGSLASFSSNDSAAIDTGLSHETKFQPNSATGATPTFLKEALKRAPFLFLAKTTPETLPRYNMNSDFRYFFIGDYMAAFSCLHSRLLRRAEATRRKTSSDISGMFSSGISGSTSTPIASRNPVEPVRTMTNPTEPRIKAANNGRGHDTRPSPLAINAKALFPTTYEHTFAEDADVAENYQYPACLNVVEPVRRPGVDTVVYMTKTSVDISSRSYILAMSAPYDDVEMGLTKMKSGQLTSEIADLGNVPLRWFEGAFVSFPHPMAIVDKFAKPVKINDKMSRWEDWSRAVEKCMAKVREVRMMTKNAHDCWEFSGIKTDVDEGGENNDYRVWVWRPMIDNDQFAICFRKHHSHGMADDVLAST